MFNKYIWILGIYFIFICVHSNGCSSVKLNNPKKPDQKKAYLNNEGHRPYRTAKCCEAFAYIADGWDGFRWGTMLDEFKCKCQDINCQEGDNLLIREKCRARFLGYWMKPCYGFNRLNQFSWVMLIPEMADRPFVKERLIKALGPGIGNDPIWREGCLQIEVNPTFHTIMITNGKFEGK